MKNIILEEVKIMHKRAADIIDEFITEENILGYAQKLMDTPAPSTTVSRTRGETVKEILVKKKMLNLEGIEFHQNYRGTGNTVIFTGINSNKKPLWYFAHLDSISYLIREKKDNKYRLVPFCYHLLADKRKVPAGVLRYDVENDRYYTFVEGYLFNDKNNTPCFEPSGKKKLQPGDRVYIKSCTEVDKKTGIIKGDLDNAAVVAAQLAALPVLEKLGIDTVLAFPDEEEGPAGKGSQTIGRGGSRLVELLPPPRVAVVGDLQKGSLQHDEGLSVIGEGPCLTEFSSQGRGAVTPPHLYAMAEEIARSIEAYGISIQNNTGYAPRSDDISILRRTPNIVLLGLPATDRHYDTKRPTASVNDIVQLSRSYVYFSVLANIFE